jgi:uncharacterized damage-inducible protein DinB
MLGWQTPKASKVEISPQHIFKLGLMHRLEQGLSGLDTILEGVSGERLHRLSSAGKWSPHHNLAHLGRSHEIFLERLEQMVSSDDPPHLEPYQVDQDPNFAAWLEMPTGGVISELRQIRRTLLERVALLEDRDLERLGYHPVYGAMPLKKWLELFLAHEGHHVYVIFLRLGESKEV